MPNERRFFTVAGGGAGASLVRNDNTRGSSIGSSASSSIPFGLTIDLATHKANQNNRHFDRPSIIPRKSIRIDY